MGEFLSQPIKDKVSDDGESTSVIINLIYSFDMLPVECKAGEKEWKIPT
jgi:hypothetical protein